MANDDIEDFGNKSDTAPSQYPQAEGGATGRLEESPKKVNIPSVVSSKKSESRSISTTVASSSDASSQKAQDANSSSQESAGREVTRPLGQDSTGKISSVSVSDEAGIAASTTGNVASSSVTGKISPSEATGKISSLDEAVEKIDSDKAAAIDALSVSSASPSLSGAYSGSLSLDPANQKSIDIRKEQIQRAKKRQVDQKRKKTAKLVRRIVFAVVAVLIIAAVGVLSYFRWGAYDDHADMQGTWVIEGTNTKVKISEDKIRLNKEVSYSYIIDPMSKTLEFDFGQLDGKGRYRFSLDRNKLSLMDGKFESTDTLSEDIPWTIQSFFDFLITNESSSPDLGEGGINLIRAEEG